MSNISKRDFLKTIPAAVPATMLGGLAGGLILPATAQENNRTEVARIKNGEIIFTRFKTTIENFYHGFKWYRRKRNEMIQELCKSIKENLDIPEKECSSAIETIFDTTEETILILTFGKLRFLAGTLAKSTEVIFITKTPT